MKAFPIITNGGIHERGMNLRDYFAAAALQGYLAGFAGEHVSMPRQEAAAIAAYKYADEMMKARERC